MRLIKNAHVADNTYTKLKDNLDKDYFQHLIDSNTILANNEISKNISLKSFFKLNIYFFNFFFS